MNRHHVFFVALVGRHLDVEFSFVLRAKRLGLDLLLGEVARFTPVNCQTFRHRHIDLAKLFQDGDPTPQLMLNREVIDHDRLVGLHVLDRFLEWESSRVESYKDVASQPLSD